MPKLYLNDTSVKRALCPAGKEQELFWDSPRALDGKTHKGFGHFMFQAKADGLLSTHPPLNKRIAAIEQGTYVRRLPELKPTLPQPVLAE